MDARGGKLGKVAIDQLDGNTASSVGANGTDAIPAGAIRQLDDVGGSPLRGEVGDRRGIETRARRGGGEATVRRPGRIISRRDGARRLAKPAQLRDVIWRS